MPPRSYSIINNRKVLWHGERKIHDFGDSFFQECTCDVAHEAAEEAALLEAFRMEARKLVFRVLGAQQCIMHTLAMVEEIAMQTEPATDDAEAQASMF